MGATLQLTSTLGSVSSDTERLLFHFKQCHRVSSHFSLFQSVLNPIVLGRLATFDELSIHRFHEESGGA
jgi:hypothetical protein